MAKLKGPLLSLEARGSLGPGLTYSERKSGSQVRIQQKQVIPKPSFASTDNQSLYRLIIARWNSFTKEQRDLYNEEVKTENLQISGWNLFVKKAMLDPKTYLGLAGFWTFNREGSGTVLDISKNGNHGTLQPDYPANAPKYIDSKNSRMRKALSFDGTLNYIDTLFNGTQYANLTFIFWARNNELPSTIFRHILDNSPGAAGYLIRTRNATNAINFYVHMTTGGFKFATVTVPDTNWHFFVAQITPTKVCFSIDAKTPSVSTFAADTIKASSFSMVIGASLERSAPNCWNGLIDEVSIYNRALSAGEIKDIYNMYNVK